MRGGIKITLPPFSTEAPENLDGALASTSVNRLASRFDSTSLSVQTRSGEMSACKATLGWGWGGGGVGVGVGGGVWGWVWGGCVCGGGGERNAIPRSLSISIFALSPWWSRFGGNSRCDGMALELPLGKASIKHRHPLMAVRAQHPP